MTYLISVVIACCIISYNKEDSGHNAAVLIKAGSHDWQGLSGEKEKRELQFELHVPSLVVREGEISNSVVHDMIEFIEVIKEIER